MQDLQSMMTQISGFSIHDSEVFKKSVIALTSSLWVMNVFTVVNLSIGLSNKDRSILSNAKNTLISEMKRLDYNLADFEIIKDKTIRESVVLQINLKQKSDQIIANVNLNLRALFKLKLIDLSTLYSYFYTEKSGISLTVTGSNPLKVSDVKTLLGNLSHDLQVSSLIEVMDLYGQTNTTLPGNEISVTLRHENPYKRPGSLASNTLYLKAPIHNDFNCPFLFLAVISNLLYFLEVKSNECDVNLLLKDVELLTFRNTTFGQSHHYQV